MTGTRYLDEAASGDSGEPMFVNESFRFVPEGRRIGSKPGAMQRPRERKLERKRRSQWANQQRKKKEKEEHRKAEKESREKVNMCNLTVLGQ